MVSDISNARYILSKPYLSAQRADANIFEDIYPGLTKPSADAVGGVFKANIIFIYDVSTKLTTSAIGEANSKIANGVR